MGTLPPVLQRGGCPFLASAQPSTPDDPIHPQPPDDLDFGMARVAGSVNGKEA
jgi:hypothetical protein